MNGVECPQCKKTLKSSAARLVQDSCGHKKCRLCLLADEAGCPQCSAAITTDTSNILNLIKPKEEPVIKYENNQTAVITCNKFCSPIKSSSENILIYHNNSKAETVPIYKNDSHNRKLFDFKGNSEVRSKRKYSFLIVPNHISVLKGQENGETYKCNICQKSFHTKYYVKFHLYCAEGNKPFKCERCSKSFVSKSQLESHCLIHLSVAPYVCDICHKSFKEKSKLKRHKVTHVESASYVCQKCGKTFKSKEYLKVHSYTHEEDKPFNCQICNAKFSNLSNMKKHLAKHSKDKNHMCDQCGKRFKLKWSLTVHRRSHTRLRLHKCLDCSKAFINAKELRRHLLTHLDVKAFSCSLCKTNFRRKDNLERHIKNTHPGKTAVTIKSNVEELIRNKLNKPLVEKPPEPIIEKPNAIKVITSQPITSTNSPAINAPLKLAFKTKAFKSHYNIHGREYIEPSSNLQSRSYDSEDIYVKILSPYSPSPSKIKPVSSISEKQSKEICQKILNSAPIDNDQLKQHAYRSIKFKLPLNYSSHKNDRIPNIQPLKPVQEERMRLPNISSTVRSTYKELTPVLPVNCTTSVIVNSPYTNKI